MKVEHSGTHSSSVGSASKTAQTAQLAQRPASKRIAAAGDSFERLDARNPTAGLFGARPALPGSAGIDIPAGGMKNLDYDMPKEGPSPAEVRHQVEEFQAVRRTLHSDAPLSRAEWNRLNEYRTHLARWLNQVPPELFDKAMTEGQRGSVIDDDGPTFIKVEKAGGGFSNEQQPVLVQDGGPSHEPGGAMKPRHHRPLQPQGSGGDSNGEPRASDHGGSGGLRRPGGGDRCGETRPTHDRQQKGDGEPEPTGETPTTPSGTTPSQPSGGSPPQGDDDTTDTTNGSEEKGYHPTTKDVMANVDKLIRSWDTQDDGKTEGLPPDSSEGGDGTPSGDDLRGRLPGRPRGVTPQDADFVGAAVSKHDSADDSEKPDVDGSSGTQASNDLDNDLGARGRIHSSGGAQAGNLWEDLRTVSPIDPSKV